MYARVYVCMYVLSRHFGSVFQFYLILSVFVVLMLPLKPLFSMLGLAILIQCIAFIVFVVVSLFCSFCRLVHAVRVYVLYKLLYIKTAVAAVYWTTQVKISFIRLYEEYYSDH